MKKLITLFAVICLCLHFSALAEENKAVTRIEFIAYVMSGIEIINSDKDPMFTDLSKTDKYYNYAAAAKEYEIVNGYADNTLHPYEKLTREDAIVILCRAYKIKPVSDIYIKNFSDYKEISEYARGYVSAAVLNNILYYEKGTDFGPKGNISIDEATRLEESFKKYINTTMHFSFGYPKEAEEKVYGAISISIKVSRPCTVYYKLVPVSGYLGGFRPTEKDINNFITAVSAADTVIDINIYPEDWGEYDLYITAVDNDGNYAEAERVADVTAHRYYAGKGTEKEPYLIYNREQLEGIKYYPDSCFRLEEDIVITREWDPINIESKGYIGFAGVLDGNYHKITNLTVNKYSKNAGLFTAVYGGKIKKLYVDATIKGSYNVGIIAGLLEGGSVSECFVTGRVYASEV